MPENSVYRLHGTPGGAARGERGAIGGAPRGSKERGGTRSGSPYPRDAPGSGAEVRSRSPRGSSSRERPASRSRSRSPARQPSSPGLVDSASSFVAAWEPPISDKPGARAHLVKWNSQRTCFTIGQTDKRHVLFNGRRMADHYKVPLESKCWPVLCSHKPGEAALVFCDHWGKPGHESGKSAAHVAPAGWDASYVKANFTTVKEPGGASSARGSREPTPTRSRSRSPGRPRAPRSPGATGQGKE